MGKLKPAIALLIGLVIAGIAAAFAQPYPRRPIRIIVPYTPGGASDVTARLLAEKFTATWGTSVVVDNRPGATGIIGTDIVAKANSDGYTLGLVPPSFAVNPSTQKLPYDSDRDFTLITVTASVPMVLLTTNNLPVKNVRELIDLARAKPGALSYASSGTGGSIHLATELFMLMTGARLTHVPYKGSTQAHPDLISGQVNVMIDTIVAIVQLVKAGRIRALGVTTATRSPELPDLPRIAEAGVPEYEAGSWGMLLGPAKIPTAIVRQISAEAIRVLRLPDVRERLLRLGAEPVGNSPEEARRYYMAEREKWAKTVRAANIKPES